MKRVKLKEITSYFSSETGLSLIEILASVTILFILTLSFLPMFAQSARTNNVSKDMMNATYTAESSMETAEKAISSATAIDSLSTPMTNSGYRQSNNGCTIGTCYESNSNGFYVFIQFTNSDSGNQLVNVKVKVYSDNTKTRQQAQMETLLFWNK